MSDADRMLQRIIEKGRVNDRQKSKKRNKNKKEWR